jgi:hypothetical protein
LFRTNDTNPLGSKIEIPYKSRVIHGSLDYRVNSTAYYSGVKKSQTNSIFVVNRFSTPISIKSADIEDTNFKVTDFKSGTTILPKNSQILLNVVFSPNDSSKIHKSNLILDTNITKLYIPLFYFHGNFQYLSYDNELETFENIPKLNFGIIGLKEKKYHRFYLKNPNPVSLPLDSWKIMLDGKETNEIKFEIENVIELFNNSMALPSKIFASALTDEDDYSFLSVKLNKKTEKNPKIILKPGYKALIKITISSSMEDEHQGDILVKSSYDTLSVPFQFVSSTGDLKFEEELNFGKIFPGKTIKKNMFVTNTHKYLVNVNQITSSNDRMIPYLVNELLEPSKEILIGQVLFDSNLFFDDYKDTVFSDTLVSDADLIQHKKRMAPFKDKDSMEIKSKISLHTNLLKRFNFRVVGSIQKPKLSTSKIDFKLVHIGTAIAYYVRVKNPTDFPLKVKLFLGGDNFTMNHQDTPFRLSQRIETLLPPNTVTDLGPLIFSPNSLKKSESFLYVKNNLTIFEKIPIFGEGGIGHVVFKQNGKIEDKLINWKITEDEIGKFENEKFMINSSLKNEDDYIVFTKKFLIQNLGNLPIDIQSMSIDENGCSGYGVKIQNCESVVIQPKAEKEFILTFQPDFTTSKLNFYIHFESEIGKHSYSTIIELPHSILPHLYDSQPITFAYSVFRTICTWFVVSIAMFMLYKVWIAIGSFESGKIELPILTTDLSKSSNEVYSPRKIHLNMKPTTRRISPVRRSPRKFSPMKKTKSEESLDDKEPKKKKLSKKKRSPNPSPGDSPLDSPVDSDIKHSPMSSTKESPRDPFKESNDSLNDVPVKDSTRDKDSSVDSSSVSPSDPIHQQEEKKKTIEPKSLNEIKPKNDPTKKEVPTASETPKEIEVPSLKKKQDPLEEKNKKIKKQPNKKASPQDLPKTNKKNSLENIETTKPTLDFDSPMFLNGMDLDNNALSPPTDRIKRNFVRYNDYEETNVLSRLSQALKPTSNDSYFSLFTDPFQYGQDSHEKGNYSTGSRFVKNFGSNSNSKQTSSSFFSMEFPPKNSLFEEVKLNEESFNFEDSSDFDNKNDETFTLENEVISKEHESNQEEDNLPDFFKSH